MWKLQQIILLAMGLFSVLMARQASAQVIDKIPELNQRENLTVNSEHWLSQLSTPDAKSPVQVKKVNLKVTETGIEVILETNQTERLQPNTRSEGNTLILDIPNSQLVLANAQEFRSDKPVAGITSVTVTQIEGNIIRVRVIADAGVPKVELFDNPDEGLIFSFTPIASSTQPQQPETSEKPTTETQPEQPSSQGDEPIELVVTGEQDGYKVPNASTATRTDTPLRDIPQSIQVIPQQVIKDQGITRIEDALRNAVGVTQEVDRRSPAGSYTIRGFAARGLRNGFGFTTSGGGVSSPIQLPNNVEQIEVLRGPDSVLNGSGDPGGAVNYITKQPLNEPYYAATFTAGQFSFYQPSIDLTGPLTDDKRLLYRLTAAYQNYGSYFDFVKGQAISIAPTISYKIGDDTTLKFEYEYSYYRDVAYSGLPLDPISFTLPISRNFQYPDIYRYNVNHALILSLEHKFNSNISLRTAFQANFSDSRDRSINLGGFNLETNQVGGNYQETPNYGSDYSSQTSLTAKFNTGSIGHQLLAGIDLGYSSSTLQLNAFDGDLTTDIFNPTYDRSFGEVNYIYNPTSNSNTVGVYLQDQVTLLPNVKLLIGGRYDFLNEEGQTRITEFGETTESSYSFYNEAFSPRVGLVYQPIQPISLYVSFNQSFVPNNTTTRIGELIQPTRGTQYEVGIKTEFGDLAANLAAYQITKTNILRTDPIDDNFQIPIGEIRSRGIEFDIGGEILPGWNIIASAFLNQSIVTVGDEFSPEGETLGNSPRHGASIWTTYQIQQGDLQGFGFGLGVFYVGDRETAIPNNFVLPSYVRADASLFYRRENWDVQLNFKNLSNNRYYEGSTAGLTQPGAPFNVQGTISVRF